MEESLDNSIKSAEDVERLISAPALAIIPSVPADGASASWLKSRRDKRTAADTATVELAVLKHPTSSLAESFRALRTSVLLSTSPQPPQTLLVTSPQPNEGKSTTTLNLAMALAQRGARVVIVDSDLRKPGIAQSLGLPHDKGLSSLLTGAHTLDEVLVQYETIPTLWVLAAGPRPPNPAELLSSPTMDKVLREMRKRFDHVVMNSPPLLVVTDATILSTLVDGVVMVVESGETTRGAVLRAYRILTSAGARILGVVMNKVDLRRDGYYYYGSYYGKHYYYSSYYAYGEDSEATVSKSEGDQLPPKQPPGTPPE